MNKICTTCGYIHSPPIDSECPLSGSNSDSIKEIAEFLDKLKVGLYSCANHKEVINAIREAFNNNAKRKSQ